MTNIVARMPGTASTGAILLVGNYDSMPTTPGAGDPDSSAAVVLETVRALRADGSALRNDVIVGFMDADPNGLIGDQAFVAEHPWARDARLVFAFANSGVGGPVALESITAAGRRFTPEILQVAPHPLAYSSLTGLLRLVGDGGPMLWAARATGAAGAEFVALDEPQTYHVATSTPDRIDPRTLQYEGSYALALTRQLRQRLIGRAERT